MNVNSRIARANFTGNAAGPIASFTAYRSSNASILIDDHYFTPADNKAKVCNTPMPVAPLWSIDSSFDGTVAFNQLVKNGNFANTSDWRAVNATFSVSNNIVTINPTAQLGRIIQNIAFPYGHKMLAMLDFKGKTGNTYYFNNILPPTTGTDSWISLSKIMESNVQTGIAVFFMAQSNEDDFTYPFYAKNAQVIDLTQMFGSTIADYIYSLEQGTAGAGAAFFRSIYPNDYYAYDADTDEMVGSREGSIITLPIDVKTSITPNIGSNNIFADCGYVDVNYVTI